MKSLCLACIAAAALSICARGAEPEKSPEKSEGQNSPAAFFSDINPDWPNWQKRSYSYGMDK